MTQTITIWDEDIEAYKDLKWNIKLLLKQRLIVAEQIAENFFVISGDIVLLEAIYEKSFYELASLRGGFLECFLDIM